MCLCLFIRTSTAGRWIEPNGEVLEMGEIVCRINDGVTLRGSTVIGRIVGYGVGYDGYATYKVRFGSDRTMENVRYSQLDWWPRRKGGPPSPGGSSCTVM